MAACPGCEPSKKNVGKADFVVALAGNANVGKSTIFNELTGVDQIIGNWPGKTVERAEALLQHKGYRIKVVDLPGIYSFSTFSMEEIVSRDFIAIEKPAAVVNVIDATTLERNLFFTMQLLELNAPLIIALNQADLLEKRGVYINTKKLEKMLGVPVVLTSAISGKGISELTDKIIEVVKAKKKVNNKVRYGKEIEDRIKKLEKHFSKIKSGYHKRWIAIKLLEGDSEIKKLIRSKKAVSMAKKFSNELTKIHGHDSTVVITAERYHIADRIARHVQSISPRKYNISDIIDKIALHPVLGYFILVGVIVGLLVWTFVVGFKISLYLSNWLAILEQLSPVVQGSFLTILWNGAFTGFVAGVTLVIPYVLPFYLFLAFLEDSGYLTRISFMLDRGMHKLGLHGKAIIPLLLGYGCNVPACFSCRVMETPKQKFVSAFLVTLIPCTARTVVILGLVAAFINIQWALALFAFDILLIILLGMLAFRVVPGESVGLIMEMPNYHLPSFKVIFKQTWTRTKSLIWIVFPIYIIGSAALQVFYAAGLLDPINNLLKPITVSWLMLPSVVGILLIFGIVRKEMTILMLAVLFGTTNFLTILTPVQMIVLSLVTMIYIPCLATIFALAKEFGWKRAWLITIIEIAVAILIGGLAARVLPVFF
ncbi:ferrous iron transport protein B [Candidatus Pacearchaeota archaeon]|nr:ferrous iron transport protein B [Candidatus Pacearchaeota archaeon]